MTSSPGIPSDKVTDQRALTTASGTTWLVIGAILTVLCGGLLFAMQWIGPPGIGLAGCANVLVLYAAMLAIRFAVRPGRVRLGTLAVLTILIAITFFIFGGIVTATVWGAVPAH
jgi:hypothetical protein